MGMSAYIASMRRHVGHDLLLLPAAGVVPLDDRGRLMLVRHADDGKWGTLGGAIDPDEAPADAARREALEEAGVEVDIVALRAVIGGPRFRMHYPNGDVVSYVGVIYEGRVVGGTARPDGDETLEVGWFPVEDLPGVAMNDFTRALMEEARVAEWARPVP
jgi:8-oxo-dGTP pyrophosphatase MutT (NUDIX family)